VDWLTVDDVGDECKGDTGEDDEEIGNGQIGEEDVGGGIAHRPASAATEYGEDDEEITNETGDENETVRYY